ncbi:MAG: hypothetical protein ACI9CP_000175, partial [Cryomorphaceae bacterium]
MKKLLLSLVALAAFALSSFGQSPEGFKYQAVVRDAMNVVLNNQAVGIQLTIQQGSIGGTAVYTETFAPTTNAYGLVNLEIGSGTSADDFTTIDWANGPYFMETAVDVTGGTSYSVMGTSQLMSVPYALYANTSGNGAGPAGADGNDGSDGAVGATGPQGPQGNIGSSGDDGVDGIDGTNGIDGAVGATGPQGPQGNIGSSGDDGVDGIDGNNGSDGAVGATGPQGPQGNIGSSGDDGVDGIDGTNGIDGAVGATGPQGPQGNIGSSGDDGVDGIDGNNGSDGNDGVTGPAGSDGTNGSDGADGIGIAQTLLISGDTLFISSGNYILIPGLSLINSFIVEGCTDSTAFNYNAAANTDDGSCSAVVNGCTDPTAFNYNASANTDDGSCIAAVNGCTDPTAFNYDASANTDDGSCIIPFSGAIGDTYQGGIVFYLDGNGGGLISALTDQSTGVEWGCSGTLISGADGTAIGTGAQNTIDIQAGCTTSGIAADICANLTLGGYSDWFLPSKDELNLMWTNLADSDGDGFIAGPTDPNNIGDFANTYYWSSTELDIYGAWLQDYANGFQTNYEKSSTFINLRAIRAFSAPILGCTDPLYTEYDALANTDDGSCTTLVVNGCTDPTAF